MYKAYIELNIKIVLVALLLTSILSSCREKESSVLPGVSENCTFSYNHETTELKWTAFKFTERIGVSGTFDNITVKNTSPASSPPAVFRNAAFSIKTDSVNSANAERDAKISASFFGIMKENGSITGRVKKITPSTAAIEIEVNNVSRVVDFNYKVVEETGLEAYTTIDLADFKALKSVNALNEVCSELHTGKDGVSKLWPDVELRIFSRLDKNCS